MTYDKMGRVLTETDPLGGNGSQNLTLSYAYDELGQRIKEWNSQLSSSVVATTDYDAEGRVIQTKDMDNYATNYSYAWQASLGAHGAIEDDGGWKKITTPASGLANTVYQDNEGRTVKVNYQLTLYQLETATDTYDSAGRLAGSADSYLPDWTDGADKTDGTPANHDLCVFQHRRAGAGSLGLQIRRISKRRELLCRHRLYRHADHKLQLRQKRQSADRADRPRSRLCVRWLQRGPIPKPLQRTRPRATMRSIV
ncbi:MAG: hypothetical protein WDM89_01260 [Rhizomicrobium sp.]